MDFFLFNFKINLETFLIICNEKICKVLFGFGKIDLNFAVKLMPNLKTFSVVQQFENGWEKMILKWNLPKLRFLCHKSKKQFLISKFYENFVKKVVQKLVFILSINQNLI